MESSQITKLTIRFLKEYGIFSDYLAFFRKEHPEYIGIRDGFHVFLNNQLVTQRYVFFDFSVGHCIVFQNYAWYLSQKKRGNVWDYYFDLCDIYKMYMDENGCTNATPIETEPFVDVNRAFPIW